MQDETSKIKYLPRVGKLSQNTAELRFMGDLVIPRLLDAEAKEGFAVYQKLFEQLASIPKIDRILTYRFLAGLILTSHARRTQKREERQALFQRKNEIIRSILEDPQQRAKIKLSRLKSDRRKLVKHCDECTQKITAKEESFYTLEPCENCETQAGYFDVISLFHRSTVGFGSLFLSIDRASEMGLELPEREASLNRSLESYVFEGRKIHYRALFGFDIQSTLKLVDHLCK